MTQNQTTDSGATATIRLPGVAAAPGLARGPAAIWCDEILKIPREGSRDPGVERGRLVLALQAAQARTLSLKEKAIGTAGTKEAAIFEAQALMLEDPALLETAHAAIDGGLNAEAAWIDAVESFAVMLDGLSDPTLAARAADVRDIGRRVLVELLGCSDQQHLELIEPSVIVARDLAPSQTISLNRKLVLGFCTAEGGPTSHTAILAKALCAPAVVALGPAVLEVPRGALILVDGEAGEVVVHPDVEALERFETRCLSARRQAQAECAAAHQPAVTRDGHRVEVVANVGGTSEATIALENGAEGIGLLRTEFLYLRREIAPGEAEQLETYRAILTTMGTRPVVARTLDAGGDKELPYLGSTHEANPFLGWRAIRICLDLPDLFKTQLRALWRASPGHNLRIMFPMIATLEEVRRAKVLLSEAREESIAAGHPVASAIQVGIMVEIPAVAVLADNFAREVDFFSIGTNDLTQYTLAAERTNEKVAHLNDACHPAVLSLIRRVIEAAHHAGIWVGLCGELAGDPDAIPILLGLGLDEFSMAPALIPHAKAILRSWSCQEANELARQALDLTSAAEVRERSRACAANNMEGHTR